MADGRRPRGRRRRLSPEERDLWSRVAQTATPLRPDTRKHAAEPRPAPAEPAGALHAQPPPAFRPPDRSPSPQPPRAGDDLAAQMREAALDAATQPLRPGGRPAPRVSWSPPSADRPAPVGRNTPGLDGGTAKRLARGRLEPQGRLDLHGMTADRAHGALSGFIAASSAQGLRCVLIVTGMGRGEGGRGDGVLRRQTPRWLGVAPLASMVVGVFEAHPRHGGAGALYVYLKKRR